MINLPAATQADLCRNKKQSPHSSVLSIAPLHNYGHCFPAASFTLSFLLYIFFLLYLTSQHAGQDNTAGSWQCKKHVEQHYNGIYTIAELLKQNFPNRVGPENKEASKPARKACHPGNKQYGAPLLRKKKWAWWLVTGGILSTLSYTKTRSSTHTKNVDFKMLNQNQPFAKGEHRGTLLPGSL